MMYTGTQQTFENKSIYIPNDGEFYLDDRTYMMVQYIRVLIFR